MFDSLLGSSWSPWKERASLSRPLGGNVLPVHSGWTRRRRMGPGGCETHVLEAALHGIREGVYVPMFLMDLSWCETCVIMTPCFNPGGLEALEALDPGLASRAQAVADMVEKGAL